MVGTTSHQHLTLIDLTHDSHIEALFLKLASRQAIGHASDTTRICDVIQCCDIPSCTRRIACRRLSHTRHERTRGLGRHRPPLPFDSLPFGCEDILLECSNLLWTTLEHTENTDVVTLARLALCPTAQSLPQRALPCKQGCDVGARLPAHAAGGGVASVVASLLLVVWFAKRTHITFKLLLVQLCNFALCDFRFRL
jgi:hypothetical protein